MAARPTAVSHAHEPEKLRAVFEDAWRAESGVLARRVRLTRTLAPVADALSAHLAAPGKRVRPLLLLGAWRAFSHAKKPPPSAVALAVALELVHSFILVHDDIIDVADSRRGEPTLHRRIERTLGVPAATANALALVAGDLAFNYAWAMAAGAPLPPALRGKILRVFADTIHETGAGELLETVNTTRPLGEVAPAEIARTYHAKTTRYTIEAPLVLGAMLAGAPPAAIRALVAAAKPLGLAFQLENDAHEVARLVEGNTCTDDLAAGVKTRPLRLLHDLLDETGRASLAHALAHPHEQDARSQLAALIRATNLRARLGREVEGAFARAARELAHARLAAPARAGIEAVFAFLNAHRHHSEAVAAQPQPNEQR